MGLWADSGLLLLDIWEGKPACDAGLRFLVPSFWHNEKGQFRAGDDCVAMEAIIGSDVRVSAADWWPRFGERQDALAIQILPQLSQDKAMTAVYWGWGTSKPFTPEMINKLANALSSASRSSS